ncbi:MAG TPA: phosphatase PAP2 family protein [Chitinophagaceae bacterium]|nr:phosphatase PAP2 family protein [Chitinophagaceae bacterium]
MRKIIILASILLPGIQGITQVITDSVSHNDTIDRIVPATVVIEKSTEVYKLKTASDIPVTAIGTGWSLYAFSRIYSKDRSSVEKILSLDKNNIPSFDRRGASVYHPKADNVGDMLFYSSMPLPVILMLDKEIRKDGLKIALLYLESMSITGLLYTGSVYLNDRFRPYAYNPDVPMDRRTRGGAKNSFFAGHVALVGTSTFFIAKVLNDYHPDSKVKWIPFTLAGIATGTTAWARYRGGQHFISDIALGAVVGVLSGILVPHVHKNKDLSERRLSFTSSYLGSTPQFGITYKLMK